MTKLSIIIPSYNEEKYIEKVISLVKEAKISISKEIIIVDDGSKDNTRQILKKYIGQKGFKIIFHPRNLGKGMAVRSGIEAASGDIIMIQDADLEYSVKDYPALLEPILTCRANVVYGSRFKGKISEMKWSNWLANKIVTKTTNLLYGLKVTDIMTAYKVFTKKVIKDISLKCRGFELEPEITAKLAKKSQTKIVEVPIQYQGRNLHEGKKIVLKDAFIVFWTLIKYRFKD